MATTAAPARLRIAGRNMGPRLLEAVHGLPRRCPENCGTPTTTASTQARRRHDIACEQTELNTNLPLTMIWDKGLPRVPDFFDQRRPPGRRALRPQPAVAPRRRPAPHDALPTRPPIPLPGTGNH